MENLAGIGMKKLSEICRFYCFVFPDEGRTIADLLTKIVSCCKGGGFLEGLAGGDLKLPFHLQHAVRSDCFCATIQTGLTKSSRVRWANQAHLIPLTEPYVRASYTAPAHSILICLRRLPPFVLCLNRRGQALGGTRWRELYWPGGLRNYAKSSS